MCVELADLGEGGAEWTRRGRESGVVVSVLVCRKSELLVLVSVSVREL